MCGLVGIAGNLGANTGGKSDSDVFKELLFVSCFRGIDSTGIAVKSRGNDETSVIKMTVPSPDFLDTGKVKKAIFDGDMLLMGHTRFKTVGEINKRNAQPFEFDNLVGCHNGTLSWGTKNILEGQLSLPTDSEALYTSIANDGFEKTIAQTHKEDAMALTWFDKKTQVLNFYRNTHRTLYYVFNKEMDRVYWASEAGMLYLVLNRNRVEFGKVKLLPENLHWQVELPAKKEKLPKTVTRFCAQPPKPEPVKKNYTQTSIWGTDNNDHRHFNGRRTPDVVDTTVKNVPSKTPLDKNVIILDRELTKFKMSKVTHRDLKDGGAYYRSPNGKLYTLDDFKDKMFEQCSMCGCTPAWGEPVKFLKDESFLCATCVADAKHEYTSGKMSGATLTLLSFMS